MTADKKTNAPFAEHMTMRDAVETAREHSVAMASRVAVAYDSTRYDSAAQAVFADDLAVVEVDECDFGEPWRWGEYVYEHGKKSK